MKAIVVERPGVYGLREVEPPRIIRPDDVLVRVRAVGICGSDLHLLCGGNSAAQYPRIPGHEIVGEVQAIGDGVTGLAPGDRVIAEPLRYCGDCHACRRGRRNVCQHLQIVSVHVDGGFAEYFVSPARNLFHLPDDIGWALATAIEPCTIGEQAHARAGTLPGDTVLIHGAGPIGLMVLDTAKRLGARAIVSDPSESRRRQAVIFGADAAIDPQKDDLRALVMQQTGGVGANEIFDATDDVSLLPLSIELAATAGAIVPLSFSSDPVTVNFAPLNQKELTIAGTRHQYKMFPKVLAALPARMEMLRRFVTHTFPLEQYEQAFALAGQREADACKIVLTV